MTNFTSKIKVGAVAGALALLAGLVVGAPAQAATTVDVTLTVTNFDEYNSYATLYEAPSKWISAYDLTPITSGSFDPDTHTLTFTGVPSGTQAFVGIHTYGSGTLVQDFYVGATSGLAYPLATSAVIGTGATSLGTSTIPSYGALKVTFKGKSLDRNDVYLANAVGEVLGSSTIPGTGKAKSGTFSKLVPGKYKVCAWGSTNYLDGCSGVVTVASGATATVDWLPGVASKITGKVTNAAGKPIKGVQVSAYNDTSGGSAITDAKGKYTLGGLRKGTYQVYFTAPPTGGSAVYVDASVKVKGVKAGATKKLATKKLVKGGTLTGKVGFSGAEAYVYVVGPKDSATVVVKKKSKKYTIKGLKPGNYTVYLVDKNSKIKYGTTKVTVKAKKTVAAKKISATKSTVTLSGKITGGNKANTSVQAYLKVGKATYYGESGIAGYASADTAGKYKIKGLIPGTFLVSTCSPNAAKCANASVKVTKSKTKNFASKAAAKATKVKLTYNGKVIGAQYTYLQPSWSVPDASGTFTVYWDPYLAGQKPLVSASDIFGYGTPFYFALNKSTVKSAADVKALAITGIGGK